MGVDPEEKDEREISFSIEVGTGALLPGGRIALAFRRVWQRRADRYLKSIARSAGVHEDRVVDALAEDDAFGDIFIDGLRIATSQSDDLYGDIFARFVAQALGDPAQIEVASFLLERFGRLRPSHIKVFWFIGHKVADQRASNTTGVEPPGSAEKVPYTIRQASKDLELPQGIILSLMRDLDSEGIINIASGGGGRIVNMEPGARFVNLTDLGWLAFETATKSRT